MIDAFLLLNKLNPYYEVVNVCQQNFALNSSAHRLFCIERITNYFEIQNRSMCLSRWLGRKIPKPRDKEE